MLKVLGATVVGAAGSSAGDRTEIVGTASAEHDIDSLRLFSEVAVGVPWKFRHRKTTLTSQRAMDSLSSTGVIPVNLPLSAH